MQGWPGICGTCRDWKFLPQAEQELTCAECLKDGGIFEGADGGQRHRREIVEEQRANARQRDEAAKQAQRLGGLQEEQLARAATALEAFRAAFAVNLEDITHIELMKMQQGKATADVRIVLAESAAQQAAIDAQTSTLDGLLRGNSTTVG